MNALGWSMFGFEYPKAQSWIMNHRLQQLCDNIMARITTSLVPSPRASPSEKLSGEQS